jgi:DNA-binding PadR family transcriptional regulator
MAILALLAERPAHGWALSRELGPDGEIGEIWSGDRQRIYRALRKLAELGLIEAALVEPGGGGHRTVYRPTATGREELRTWLAEPVDRLQEAHSTLALKLVFSQRAGLDPTPLLTAQRATVVAAMESISRKLRSASPASSVHLRLRLETTRALLSFIDSQSATVAGSTQPARTSRRRTRRRSKPGAPVSDFSGVELGDERSTATVIIRFGDTRRGIRVASAHVDDPIVAEIEEAGRPAGSAGERGA